MEQLVNVNQLKWRWWQSQRIKYNKGLVIAGICAFLLYCIVGEVFVAPHEEFEVTLFTVIFQGIGYLVLMMIANVLYNLGYAFDILLNKKNDDLFRIRLYTIGYWFSFALPFIIPVLVAYIFITKYH